MNEYAKGANVRVNFTFTNLAGNLVDPAIVKFQWRYEGGAITTYTYLTDAQVVHVSTGTYYVDIAADSVGTIYYRGYSVGPGAGASESGFFVRSRF